MGIIDIYLFKRVKMKGTFIFISIISTISAMYEGASS